MKEAARCGVENGLEMLTYSSVRSAFEPAFALHRIHQRLTEHPAKAAPTIKAKAICPELALPTPKRGREPHIASCWVLPISFGDTAACLAIKNATQRDDTVTVGLCV